MREKEKSAGYGKEIATIVVIVIVFLAFIVWAITWIHKARALREVEPGEVRTGIGAVVISDETGEADGQDETGSGTGSLVHEEAGIELYGLLGMSIDEYVDRLESALNIKYRGKITVDDEDNILGLFGDTTGEAVLNTYESIRFDMNCIGANDGEKTWGSYMQNENYVYTIDNADVVESDNAEFESMLVLQIKAGVGESTESIDSKFYILKDGRLYTKDFSVFER